MTQRLAEEARLDYWEIAIGDYRRLQGYRADGLQCNSSTTPMVVWMPQTRTAFGWVTGVGYTWYALLKSRTHFLLYTVRIEDKLVKLYTQIALWKQDDDPSVPTIKNAIATYERKVIPISTVRGAPEFKSPIKYPTQDAEWDDPEDPVDTRDHSRYWENWGDNEVYAGYSHINKLLEDEEMCKPRCPVSAP